MTQVKLSVPRDGHRGMRFEVLIKRKEVSSSLCGGGTARDPELQTYSSGFDISGKKYADIFHQSNLEQPAV